MLVPAQWVLLIVLAWVFLGSNYALALSAALPFLLYSHIRVLEEGRGLVDNVRFLVNIAARADQVAVLRQERQELARLVEQAVTPHLDPQIRRQLQKAKQNSPHPTFATRTFSTSDVLAL